MPDVEELPNSVGEPPEAAANPREVLVDTPGAYCDARGSLALEHEEEASVWLWAFPLLFPWQQPVAWMYSPVTGNKQWPGDLWGVDTDGRLLVIESKKPGPRCDPFEDFAAFHREGREELSAEHWETKFSRHFRSEIRLPDGMSERRRGATDGILPRSHKRNGIRRWPQLCRIIDGYIRSPIYRRRVEQGLANRNSAGDPPPHYFGLIVARGTSDTSLPKQSLKSMQKLRERAGGKHVHLVSARGLVEGKLTRLRLQNERLG